MRIANPVVTLGLMMLAMSTLTAAARGQVNDPRWPSRVFPADPREERDALGRYRAPVVTAVCIQPGGPLLATTGDDHFIRIWNMQEGKLLERLEWHTDWVRALAFSPDGKMLASAGNDRTIVFWDMERLAKFATFREHEVAIAAIAFSPDGQHLAAGGFERLVRVYEVGSGQIVHELDCYCGDVRAVAYSPDGSLLAAGGRDGRIRVWRMSDGTLVQNREAHTQRIRALAFSPDGQQLVSCGEDRAVQIWNIRGDGRVVSLPARDAMALSLTFIGRDKLAVGGSDNVIRLWDLARQREIDTLVGHTGSVAAVAHRDGRLVSGSYDTTVRVWTVDFNAQARR